MKSFMPYQNFVPYKEEIWSYVFMKPDMFGVSDKDRNHIMWNIVDLHKKDEDSRDIRGDNYEGRITREKSTAMGGLCGTVFEAELETPKGKRKPSVMILSKIDASLN